MSERDDLTERLQRVLGRLGRMLRREAPSVLGQGAMSALHTLKVDGPLRPSDLAAREGIRPPTLTRILTILEDGGYLVRTPDPADRRASLVAVTELGTHTLLTTRNARAGHLARHLAGLTDEQRRILAQALPVLEALASLELPESTVD
jgi:DNA-binding MarR family transcriptional regulator